MASAEPFVYYGTSEFSRLILAGLLEANLTPQLVVTTVAKPSGRGLKTAATPVANLAQNSRLDVLEVSSLKNEELLQRLKAHGTTHALLAAFGKIIPPQVIKLYPKGIINVHPSRLPLYRGPSPIQTALLEGAAKTGVSLMLLDETVDHGPILAQEDCSIAPEDESASLGLKLAQLSIELLKQIVPAYLAGELTPTPQDHTQATFTKLISREDGQADFSQPAKGLDRRRRAFTPWPGLWTTWQGKQLKLTLTQTVNTDSKLTPGTVADKGGVITVSCGQGDLVILKLQQQGGRELTAAEFIRGHQNFVGTLLPS